IGIWYKNIAQRTYVWVANRDNPLLDSNGSFGISETNLVIRDQVNALVWSTELRIQTSPVVAELLDNGNFVLRSSNHLEDLLWQSFDFPTDTLLPHMQLGLDPKSFLTSWKSLDDPSSGDYKFKLETEVSPKLSVWDKGGRLYDSGPWNGYKFNKLPPLFNLTRTRVGPTCLFIATNETSFSRLVMAYTGLLIQYTWNQSTTEWDWSWSLFNHICDLFNRCGSNAYCDVNVNTKQFCNCIEGFEPRNSTNMTDGCTRKTPLKCGADKFIPLVQMSFPYTANTSFPGTSDIQECQDICVVRCKCTAFSITHNLQSGSLECVTWTWELLDLRRNFNASQKIYIKLDGKKKKKKNKGKIIGLGVIIPTMIVLFSVAGFCFWKKKQNLAT
ncbi:Bulb-type lectin domain, partial [Arabidopsis suecica]